MRERGESWAEATGKTGNVCEGVEDDQEEGRWGSTAANIEDAGCDSGCCGMLRRDRKVRLLTSNGLRGEIELGSGSRILSSGLGTVRLGSPEVFF